jgi:rSAM/selenodomain-associated transferase 1
MQNKKAIIIFTKNPELGKVKTRLAKTIGADKALEIYKKLLDYTRNIVEPVNVDKFVFYSETIVDFDKWENTIYHKKLQRGTDLGIRMQNAFEELFQLHYESVCIIGSDCYELNSEIIEKAFRQLEQEEVVIGPTFDGGYYLLGMNKLNTELFQNKNWSTESVYDDTIGDIKELSLRYFDLEKLSDIDEEKDVPHQWA